MEASSDPFSTRQFGSVVKRLSDTRLFTIPGNRKREESDWVRGCWSSKSEQSSIATKEVEIARMSCSKMILRVAIRMQGTVVDEIRTKSPSA